MITKRVQNVKRENKKERNTMENALKLDTVVLSEDKQHLVILDQTLLPNECKTLVLDRAEDIWEAI